MLELPYKNDGKGGFEKRALMESAEIILHCVKRGNAENWISGVYTNDHKDKSMPKQDYEWRRFRNER